MAKVLVTCVGSGVGQSVVDSLSMTGTHEIVGCDANRNVYAYHFCNYFFIVPSIYSEGYIDFLLDLSVREKVEIIIPGHDHELLLLSNNIKKFNKKGIEVIVSLPDLIKVSRDKYEWYKYFMKYGCSIVPTYRVSEFRESPDHDHFPAIVKPVGGSASQGITILNHVSELPGVNDSDIIQPYLYPKKDDPNYKTISEFVKKGTFVQMSEISIQLIFSKASEFCGIFISKNILKSGVPIFIDPIDPEKFEYFDDIMKFVPVCIEKKVKGPVNIQGRITEKGLIFFEMNMRFTGITGNRAQLGFNEVEFLVNNFLELPATLNGFSRNKLGVRQVACTTMPRKTENQGKKSVTILSGQSILCETLVKELVTNTTFSEINVVTDIGTYDSLRKYNSGPVKIYHASDARIFSVYCRSDMLVDILDDSGYNSDESIYQILLFKYEQIQKIIKSTIPVIVRISTQENHLPDKHHNSIIADFQKQLTLEFTRSVKYFIPAVQLITLNFASIVYPSQAEKQKDKPFYRIIHTALHGGNLDNFVSGQINYIDYRDAIRCIKGLFDDDKQLKSIKPDFTIGFNISSDKYIDAVLNCINPINSSRDISDTENANSGNTDSGAKETKQDDFFSGKIPLEETINTIRNAIELNNI